MWRWCGFPLVFASLVACGSAPAAEPLPPALVATAPSAVSPACPTSTHTFATFSGVDPTDSRLLDATLLVIEKSARRSGLYAHGQLIDGTCYPLALGLGPDGVYPAGSKRVEGDSKTPEGWYRTSDRPWSRYHGAITVHYPNTADADAALADGRIDRTTRDAIARATTRGEVPPPKTALGGEILLHGGGGQGDWTLGCVAYDDADIDELRGQLPPNMATWVLILP